MAMCEVNLCGILGADSVSALGCDDDERMGRLVQLVGSLFIDLLQRLESIEGEDPRVKLLNTPDKTIFKNLGLLMGLMVGVAGMWEGLCGSADETGFQRTIIEMAENAGIQLLDFRDDVVEFHPSAEDRLSDDEEDLDIVKAKLKTLGFDEQVMLIRSKGFSYPARGSIRIYN
jgi:hypothetical protein